MSENVNRWDSLPTGELGEALVQSIDEAYEQHFFPASPERAEAAAVRAREVLETLRERLAEGGFDMDEIVDESDKDGWLQVLQWAAFEYSFIRPGDATVDMVSKDILVVPVMDAMARAAQAEGDFVPWKDVRESIIAMKLVRHEAGLPPISADANGNFVHDYESMTNFSLRYPLDPSGQ